MRQTSVLWLATVLVLAGCPESNTSDTGPAVDVLGDGPAQDGKKPPPDQKVPVPDQKVPVPDQKVPVPDQKVPVVDQKVPVPDGPQKCVPEGSKFTNPVTTGKCCAKLVPVLDKLSDGKGGCLTPKCSCYVCTSCGDSLCGKGENGCNCPKDCKQPCYKEGGKFQKWGGDPNVMCCTSLVAIKDCVPAGTGCACPSCPCYTCALCGNGKCGTGENWCNCPKDCKGGTLKATVTNEVWYQGSVKCKPASMALKASKGLIVASLDQVPASSVPGTCKGHAATVTPSGSTLKLAITNAGGGACWTACWDLIVEIKGVASGTYTVSYLNLSGTITVP